MYLMFQIKGENVCVFVEEKYRGQINEKMIQDELERKGMVVEDCYEVQENELCYYIIDGRVNMTDEAVEKIINKK